MDINRIISVNGLKALDCKLKVNILTTACLDFGGLVLYSIST
jgi:hypothetical protein